MEIEGVLELHVAGVKPEEQVKVGVVISVYFNQGANLCFAVHNEQ